MTNQEMKWPINLLRDGSVVTQDGEFLGTWDTDGTDAIYQFTVEGHEAPTIMDPFVGPLCSKIAAWHQEQNT